jgi:5'(3')-deoxyribonucleotidase
MVVNPIIYVDMDEVFSDFTGGACAAFGVSREELEAHRGESWSIVQALGKASGKELTQEKFWKVIHLRGIEFWESLEVLPWADELFELLQETNLEWHIVSTPWGNEESEVGKRRWLKRYFGHGFDRYHFTKRKYLLSYPGTVLIDDAEHNTKKFASRKPIAGQAIVYPHQGNSLRHLIRYPLEHVRIELSKFLTSLSQEN